MARTNNLTNFLNDVSSAIKQKTGDSTPIPASEFDTEILSIETAGTYQTKSVTITENTTTTVIPDTGYDAIEQLTITTNVPMSQLQSKSVTITSNGNIAVLPDTNYDGMTQVNLSINVPSGSGDIKLFNTQAEMQADPTAQEGDLAVVYRNEMTIPSPGDTISSVAPMNIVELDEAITTSKSMRIGNQWIGQLDCNLSSGYCNINFQKSWGGTNFHIYYESQDGIIYTRTDGGESRYEFGTNLTIPADASEQILMFLASKDLFFGGLYQYNTNQYAIAESQLDTISDYVYGKTFYGKNGVEEGTLQNGIISDINTRDMFLYIGNKFKTGLVINNGITFQNLRSLTTLPFNLNTSNVTDMTSMFDYCTSLTEVPQLNTSNVTNMDHMFHNCNALTEIPQLDTSNVTNMNNMFYNCSTLTTIPQLDTSNVTNMNAMFYYCTNLTTIPLLDTSNVTNMDHMFQYCLNLTTIPLLDTSNITNMAAMFSSCSNLTTIPQLNTSNVTNMRYMFHLCGALTTIPLLNTSNVTNMEDMFDGCTSLAIVPQLNTSNVTNMGYMFNNCTSLTEIPLLDTSNVIGMGFMLKGCSALTTVPQLNTSNTTFMVGMFNGCTSLSNESLNNILAMCTNATKITSSKTLYDTGLTEAQANTCKTLSNYSAFIAAGWTTGY